MPEMKWIWSERDVCAARWNTKTRHTDAWNDSNHVEQCMRDRHDICSCIRCASASHTSQWEHAGRDEWRHSQSICVGVVSLVVSISPTARWWEDAEHFTDTFHSGAEWKRLMAVCSMYPRVSKALKTWHVLNASSDITSNQTKLRSIEKFCGNVKKWP